MSPWPPTAGSSSRRARARLGMERGGVFVLHVEDGAIRLEPLAAAIERVQAEVRRHVPEDVDLAAELSEARRREAADG